MTRNKIIMFTLGLILGITISSTNVVNAASKVVNAFLSPEVRYTVNGAEKKLPEGTTTLNYEGKIYVPARFIAEALGGSVEWVKDSQTVALKTPEPEYIYIEKEVIKEKDEEEKEDKAIEEEESKKEEEEEKEKKEEKDIDDFDELPEDYENDVMKLNISSIFFEENYTKVYISLENKGDVPLQLDQGETIVEVDGKEYKSSDVSYVYRSDEWYHDVRPGETIESYIVLPPIDEYEPGIELEFTIFENDMFKKTYNPSFEITWHDK